MDAKDVINLQEAYLEVYNPERFESESEEYDDLDEAMTSYERNRMRAAQRAAARNEARKQGRTGNVPGVGYVSPRQERETWTDETGRARHKTGARMPQNEEYEDYDVYDVVLSHLLDEGYAETVESAEAIMVNMGEDWMESIMIDEGMTMKDFMRNRKKLQKKEAKTDAERRGHVDRTWADTGTYSTDQARRRRTSMSDSTRQARHRVAVAPDADDEHFSADRTTNPKKLRKQRAMGEIR